MGHKTGRKPAPLEGWDIPIACAVVIVVLIVWGILAALPGGDTPLTKIAMFSNFAMLGVWPMKPTPQPACGKSWTT